MGTEEPPEPRPFRFSRNMRPETRDTAIALARGASQREFRGFHETRITSHESRLFGTEAPWMRVRDAQSETAAWGPPCTPPGRCFPARCGAAWGGYGAAWVAWATRAAASLFTIVHHCSLLFGIVQQKILRLSQCPLSVLTGNAACKVFTNHESRDTNHGFYGFHKSRDTRHESRPWLWRGMGGYGAAWAAYCPRAGVLATSAVLGGLAPFAVRRSSRRPPGSCGSGQCQRNPRRERRTFRIAQTGELSLSR